MIHLRPAKPCDAGAVAACVCEAYLPYIERIGRQPGPMLEDYVEIIRDASVQLAIDAAGRVLGVIVMQVTPEGFYIANVAVRPAVKGRGVGRMLLQFAEAEAQRHGHPSVYLATHELMVENRALYERIGYRQFDQRVVEGFPRVFLRKVL